MVASANNPPPTAIERLAVPGILIGYRPRGNVDAVAVNIAFVVDDDVADINADAKFDTVIFGDDRVTLGHLLLNLDGALGCIDRARKFDEHGIARRVDDRVPTSSLPIRRL